MTLASLCVGPVKLPLIGISIVLAAGLLRCIGVTGRWLWFDELLTVNFSAHGLWAALISALRFDLHPPLYYLQLSLWALPSRNDIWLAGNTIFWSTAAVAMLIFTVDRVYGRREGLYAGLLLAVAPAALAYSDQVRMYSLLMFLAIWAWYAQARWIEAAPNVLRSLGLIISQLAIVYTHSAGVVMLSGPVLYGAATILAYYRHTRLFGWILLETLVGLLSFPALVLALVRDVEHTRVPSLGDMARTWVFLTTGDGSVLAGYVAGIVALLLAVLMLRDRHLRLPFITLVAAPFVIAALVSYLLRPIWLERIFLTTVPFLCIVLGLAATRMRTEPFVVFRSAWVLTMLGAASWAVLGYIQQSSRLKGDGYKPAAAWIRSAAKPGDLILVADHYSYWSFLWYYAGPNWGRPQRAFIQNEKWARLLAQLPARTSEWLGLDNTDAKIERGGVTIILWGGAAPASVTTARVFVVRQSATVSASLPDRPPVRLHREYSLVIETWDAPMSR